MPDDKNNSTHSAREKIAFVFAPAIPILLPILAAGVILASDPPLRTDFGNVVCHGFHFLCPPASNSASPAVKPRHK